MVKHARVNKAARKHWTPAHGGKQSYEFDLTSVGREHPYDAIRLLFIPQEMVCDRTLFHCDYLTSVIELRAFAETTGTQTFEQRFRAGRITFTLAWNGAQYITKDAKDPSPASHRAESLEIATPAREEDLVIGDKVMFWNHRAYDAITVADRGPWRLENAVLVDKDAGGTDLYEGHGAPSVDEITVAPGPKEAILNDLLKVYNAHAQKALNLVNARDLGGLQKAFPYVGWTGSEWVVQELPGRPTRPPAYPLRLLQGLADPELIGLRDPENPTQLRRVERPIHSEEGP
jgi:hypothetical protein